MIAFTDELRQRVETVLGETVVGAEPRLRGYTPAGRWRLVLRSGASVFLKLATTEPTAQMLRAEWQVYQQLLGPFMPRVVAWQDDSARPLLVLEDLSDARWPPPWDRELVEEVRETLARVHASSAPLPRLADVYGTGGEGWETVAQDPAAFLALGLTTAEWLQSALPLLIHAGEQLVLEGDGVIHLDVRSDNLCRAPRGVVLVDWSWACRGNPALDIGFWLPSLHAEGGPPPSELLPGRADVAARVSGFFAARAGLPSIPGAPDVRSVQRQQLGPALLWAAQELALPPPCMATVPK